MPNAGEPLTYVCDWLPPDFGAVGQYAQGFAEDYAERDGRKVTLIGLTEGASVTTHRTIGAGALTTVKLHASPVPKHSHVRRMLWTIGVNTRLLCSVVRRTRFGGEVLFTGSPPYMLFFLTLARCLLRYQLIYRITDFHPECLIATMTHVPLPLNALYRLTIFLRRRVDVFQVLGEDQRQRLQDIGIQPDRITLKRDPSPVAFPPGLTPAPRPPTPKEAILLLYSGNWGTAHDVDTFVEGYIRHHREGSGRVWLWLNAVGVQASRVAERLAEQACPFVQGELAPLDRLAALLITPEAHLITLRDEFVGFALPSKVYGCVESGRHLLFVGSKSSDVDLVARERMKPDQLYLRASVNDIEGVYQALEVLADGHAPSLATPDAALMTTESRSP